MNRIKKAIPLLALFILIGLGIQYLSTLLNSDFVNVFLEEDLLTILLALLAINITTISVIMAKLQELAGKGKLDYSNVIEEMRISLKEQVFLIVTAVLLLIFKKSTLIANAIPDAIMIIQVGLISVFSYAIWILYSTGEGIFVIAKIENLRYLQEHKKEKDRSHQKTQ